MAVRQGSGTFYGRAETRPLESSFGGGCDCRGRGRGRYWRYVDMAPMGRRSRRIRRKDHSRAFDIPFASGAPTRSRTS